MNEQLQNLKEHIFGAHLKINRGRFNLVVFFIFIPLTILQYFAFQKTMAQVQANLAAGGGSIKGIEDLFAAPAFGWADFIEIITLFVITPFVVARLRDVGWWPQLALVPFAAPFLHVLHALTGVQIPTLLFQISTYLLMFFLCTKKSRPVIPPSQRKHF